MTSHCGTLVRLLRTASRTGSTQCRFLSGRRSLTWDSLKPNSEFSIDDAIQSVEKIAADAVEPEPVAMQQQQQQQLSDDGFDFSLSRDDLAQISSQLSPLQPPAAAAAAAAAAASNTTLDSAAAAAGRTAGGSKHWGKCSQRLLAREQQLVDANACSSLTPTYDMCSNWEWARIFLRPAFNHWQQQIQLTMEGKLWRFPIDNEQGRELDEEGNLPFQQHVMLERHLQDWVPSSGPIRHFMETVCSGLSRNPYITAREKLEHIQWYREYFADKKGDIEARYAEMLEPEAAGNE